jgi:hypothetical protein
MGRTKRNGIFKGGQTLISKKFHFAKHKKKYSKNLLTQWICSSETILQTLQKCCTILLFSLICSKPVKNDRGEKCRLDLIAFVHKKQ